MGRRWTVDRVIATANDRGVKDSVADSVAWKEYLETVVRGCEDWKDFYRACRDF